MRDIDMHINNKPDNAEHSKQDVDEIRGAEEQKTFSRPLTGGQKKIAG